MKICDYGCGKEAKFQFKNGKWCCSKNHKSCSEAIRKFKLSYDYSKNSSFRIDLCKFCRKNVKYIELSRHEQSCYLNPKNIKYCLECDKILKNKNNKFCSRSCSLTFYNKNDEHKQLLSEKIKESHQKGNRKKYNFNHLTLDERRKMTKSAHVALKQKYENIYNTAEWNNLPHSMKRRKVLEEQKEKCTICGIFEWLGKPLILHFDHINGIKSDESRTNVRFICPNCHSQTETYCGKKQNLSINILS